MEEGKRGKKPNNKPKKQVYFKIEDLGHLLSVHSNGLISCHQCVKSLLSIPSCTVCSLSNEGADKLIFLLWGSQHIYG